MTLIVKANQTCLQDSFLNPLFPLDTSFRTLSIYDEPIVFVLQSTAYCVTILLCLFSMYWLNKVGSTTSNLLVLSGVVSVAVSGGIALLTLRTFELLACDTVVTNKPYIPAVFPEAKRWMWIAAIATFLLLIIATFVVVAIPRRFTLLVLLLLPCGAVFANWALKDGMVVTPGAEYMVAIQELLCIVVSVAALRLSAQGKRLKAPRTIVAGLPKNKKKSSDPGINVPDSVSGPQQPTCACASSDTTWINFL